MLPTSPVVGPTSALPLATETAEITASDESKLKFEQLLWAELLTHTGLEKSLTLGGGDGASMFARYFVEAIAEDIAKQHPLGLLDKDLPAQAPEQLNVESVNNG
ncbi:MAG: hypothetical protein AAFV59_03925 [Pseudomonadota bacterium]